MRLYLPFRLSDKPQVGAATQCAREGAEGEGTRVPEGIEDAGTALEFAQASLAPGEMVGLLAGGMPQCGRDAGIPGSQGLSLIKGLRGHLARMVDSHETGRLHTLRRRQRL